jgi:maleylpyruvate isomerase
VSETGPPTQDILGASAAQRRFLDAVAVLADADLARPSLLPDWTVGHVLAHLARNADSHRRMLEAAERGEVADQYEGGHPARAAAIEEGARQPAPVLLNDLRTACARLASTWLNLHAVTWNHGEGRLLSGEVISVRRLPFRRWREVEVHHADLGLGFTWRDWSEDYVQAELRHQLATLEERLQPGQAVRLVATDLDRSWTIPATATEALTVRAPSRELVAWLLGRQDVPALPTLAPWRP